MHRIISFEPRITTGNLLEIAILVGAFIFHYGVLKQEVKDLTEKVDGAVATVNSLRSDVKAEYTPKNLYEMQIQTIVGKLDEINESVKDLQRSKRSF